MEELDLKELFNVFWERKFEIIAILIVAVIIGAVYSFFMVEPTYSSYTTLLLTQVNGDSENNGSITEMDLKLNSSLVSTYSELIKSNAVLREVINELNISNLSEGSLKGNIKVSAVSDTEMIKITVVNKNPNYAEIIANKTAEVFSKKIAEIYKINNVYVVDRAEVSINPNNINHTKDIVIFGFIGIVIACGYVLLVIMLDNTIKTEADIEKITGLKVLASIPDYDTKAKGGKR